MGQAAGALWRLKDCNKMTRLKKVWSSLPYCDLSQSGCDQVSIPITTQGSSCLCYS